MARRKPGVPRTRLPVVAPHESCVGCFKGDTTTGVALIGPAEWLMAALSRMEIPMEQAEAMIGKIAEDQYGCKPGKVPTSDMRLALRVCADCAAKAGLQVGPFDPEGEMLGYGISPEQRYSLASTIDLDSIEPIKRPHPEGEER